MHFSEWMNKEEDGKFRLQGSSWLKRDIYIQSEMQKLQIYKLKKREKGVLIVL